MMIEYNTTARIKLGFNFPKEMTGEKKIYTMRTLNCVLNIAFFFSLPEEP